MNPEIRERLVLAVIEALREGSTMPGPSRRREGERVAEAVAPFIAEARSEWKHSSETRAELACILAEVRAEGARAERERMGGEMVRIVGEAVAARFELRVAARVMQKAHDLLTPGMKAGVGEARARLQSGIGAALAAAETESLPAVEPAAVSAGYCLVCGQSLATGSHRACI